MTETATNLDVQELLHLAIEATDQNKHETAIRLLKEAVTKDPENAKALYLLGALHAQIGIYDRAAIEMQKAVDLDSSLSAASFQLGLLHITSGRLAEAEQAWLSLDQLEDGHFLRSFKSGLLHLANDRFKEAAQLLQQGIAANTINEALNNDMRNVLSSCEEQLASSEKSEDRQGETSSNQLFINAYNKDDSEH